MEPLRSFSFGPFTLDCSRRRLLRAGEAVALSSRGLDLLAVLIEARDRVVSRAEIMSRVWPGLTVEEHNLSVQVSKLRRALDDPGDAVIATVPGRGYRFVAPLLDDAAGPVAPPGPPSVAATRRRPVRLAAAGLAGLAAASGLAAWLAAPPARPRLSIVVLPFRDTGGPPGRAYLADAITDDLATDLAHLPGSTVIARETAEAYARRGLPAAAIGRALRVRYLLDGSVRAEGGVLHVVARLTDARTGDGLWSERFDADGGGLGDVRERIVGRLAGALDIALDTAGARDGARERPDDPDATDLFLQARSLLDHDNTPAAFDAAVALLGRALAARPDFAEANAALAEALLHRLRDTDDPDPRGDLAAAGRAVARALRLAPDRSDTLAAEAALEFAGGRLGEAAASAGAVLLTDPSAIEARDVLAAAAIAQGRLGEAEEALRTAIRLDPEGRWTRLRRLRLATVLLLRGAPAEAADVARAAIAGLPEPAPGAPEWGVPEEARLVLIAADELGGDPAAARAAYASYDAVWPHRTAWRIAALSTRALAALPGFARMMAALEAAGMPAHADEHAAGGAPPGATLPDLSFAPTPASLPGGAVIDTRALAGRVRAGAPMVILDYGPGEAVIDGALWKGSRPELDDAAFAAAALGRGADRGASVVVLADGVYGPVGNNVALGLVRAGYRSVSWYRGGEEAWAAARLPSRDLRP